MKTRSAHSRASTVASGSRGPTPPPLNGHESREVDATIERTNTWLGQLHRRVKKLVSFSDDVEDASGPKSETALWPSSSKPRAALRVRGILRQFARVSDTHNTSQATNDGPRSATCDKPQSGPSSAKPAPITTTTPFLSPLTDLDDLPEPSNEHIPPSQRDIRPIDAHDATDGPRPATPPPTLYTELTSDSCCSLPDLVTDASSIPSTSSNDLSEEEIQTRRRILPLRLAYSCPVISLRPCPAARNPLDDDDLLDDYDLPISPLASNSIWNTKLEPLHTPQAETTDPTAKPSCLAPSATDDAPPPAPPVLLPKAPPLPLVAPSFDSALPPLPNEFVLYTECAPVVPGRFSEAVRRRVERGINFNKPCEKVMLRVDAAPPTAGACLVPRKDPCQRCRLEGVPCVARRETRREGAVCVLCSVADGTENSCLAVAFGRSAASKDAEAAATETSGTRKRASEDSAERPAKRARTRTKSATPKPAAPPAKPRAPAAKSRSTTPRAPKPAARQPTDSKKKAARPRARPAPPKAKAPPAKRARSRSAPSEVESLLEEPPAKRRRTRK
ncbi:hypothetical protein PsYK624_143200 [Phanerochaete sordida]|uniref:Uncharacterized protein n=1 Tax=Phanerochaete sordida TaxID=48140 RepID=A0A9P3LK40_9APHY|nr:hypothetical protein PsYK624_143200 [Phanerochaete sordida]